MPVDHTIIASNCSWLSICKRVSRKFWLTGLAASAAVGPMAGPWCQLPAEVIVDRGLGALRPGTAPAGDVPWTVELVAGRPGARPGAVPWTMAGEGATSRSAPAVRSNPEA